MERSDACPQCRVKVVEVRRNHAIANVAEDFLKSYPDRRRSEAELKELDAKNKILDEMLRVSGKRTRSFSDSEDEEDEEEEVCRAPILSSSLDTGARSLFRIPRPYLSLPQYYKRSRSRVPLNKGVPARGRGVCGGSQTTHNLHPVSGTWVPRMRLNPLPESVDSWLQQ